MKLRKPIKFLYIFFILQFLVNKKNYKFNYNIKFTLQKQKKINENYKKIKQIQKDRTS